MSALLQDWERRKDSQLGAVSVALGKLSPSKFAEDRAVAEKSTQLPSLSSSPTLAPLLSHPKPERQEDCTVNTKVCPLAQIRGSASAVPTPRDWVS